jgi:predicted GNAT family acetyltransferase
MTTTVADAPAASRYEIHVDGDLAGVAEYRLHDGLITFTHTEVDDAFEGRGLAAELVTYALGDARTRGLAVHPSCPYVRSFIAKHPEHLDLVPEADRARFDL